MITTRSALKFDLFAEASRQHKRDEAGNPLQMIARHVDFAELARLVDASIERGDGRKGGRARARRQFGLKFAGATASLD